ncbi:hypothetical protein E1B28_011282 [Marasmius oreades]|uniref:C2H2-type domain-containing protein n=1 Tax=Marasmius oreades TaxID=181124 RepID=A0A9P7RUU0_9AGAR|nr:uncharacterized protein E1B28_011282 [Marasmius oreades]KAG7089616.1 hypothetical protein E1B28_011282 [Marasmius oreades]
MYYPLLSPDIGHQHIYQSNTRGETYTSHRHQLSATIPQLSPTNQLAGFSHTPNTPSEPSPASSVPPITPQLVGDYINEQPHFQWGIHLSTQPPHDHSPGSPVTPQCFYSAEWNNQDHTFSKPYDHITASEARNGFKIGSMMRGTYSEDGGPGNMVAHLPGGQSYHPSITQMPTEPRTFFSSEGPVPLPSQWLDVPPVPPVASAGVIEAANKRRKNSPKFLCQLCTQTFTANHGLINHKKVHLGIKEFACGYCQKAFTTKHTCKRHTTTCRSRF